MAALLLRLSGPLQSWGAASRFNHRTTGNAPTKSGVIGMLASALGRTREMPLCDLDALEFGVRIDQPGQIVMDFQTERPTGEHMAPLPLSYRYFLSDAKFMVALSGDNSLLASLDEALYSPRWPLYLGRRSCPPDGPISLGINADYEDVRSALMGEPWLASAQYKRMHRRITQLEVICDAHDGEPSRIQADRPFSFSAEKRIYGARNAYTFWVPLAELSDPENDAGQVQTDASAANQDAGRRYDLVHDPMGFF